MDISRPTNLQKKEYVSREWKMNCWSHSAFFSRNITARLAKSECVNSPTWWIPVGDRSSEKSYANQSFPVNEVTCFLLKLAPNAASSCCSWREWWLWYRLELFFSFADIIGAAHLRQLVGHRNWQDNLKRGRNQASCGHASNRRPSWRLWGPKRTEDKGFASMGRHLLGWWD